LVSIDGKSRTSVTTQTRIRRLVKRPASKAADEVRNVDYQALARFRYELRKFLAFSETAARKEKLTPQQHQALLSIKGFSHNKPVSVGELAKLLLIRHHTAVELMDRMTKLGLIARAADPSDGRRILVRLTAKGERRLRKLSKIHFEELSATGEALAEMLQHFRQSGHDSPA
jgi:DNA-binding MarR family transcriptional regulator